MYMYIYVMYIYIYTRITYMYIHTYDHICVQSTVRCLCAVSSTDEPMTGTEGISGLAWFFWLCVGKINNAEKLSNYNGCCNQNRGFGQEQIVK